MNNFEAGAIIVSMGILCGIVAIVSTFLVIYHKKRNERIVRQSIIENHVDAETAKLLIEPTKNKDSKYSSLMWGCSLIGLGLGWGTDLLLDLSEKSLGYYIVLAVGVGIGLLVYFIIKSKLEARQQIKEEEES